MAMDSNGVEATAAPVATASPADVPAASSADVVVVEETKATVVTTITSTIATTTASSSVEEKTTVEEITTTTAVSSSSSAVDADAAAAAAAAAATAVADAAVALPPLPPTHEDGEALETESSPALSSTPPKAATKKWLGGYLPKVPSLLKKPSQSSSATPAAESTAEQNATAPVADAATAADHQLDNGGAAAAAAADERRSLSEQPAGEKEKPAAATSVASRLRGLSIDQNAFARSLVGKIHGFRSQPSTASSSTGESPRHSLDGMPPLAPPPQRRSLIGNPSSTANNVPSPRSDPSLKARRGACVATRFGTGTVLDIRLDDGFYIVQLVPKSIAYLREDMILREIKAIVGERVKTRWGLATVEQYYADEDMYNIALDWRWDDDHVWRMKATTKKFEKISRGLSIVQNTKNRLFTGYSTIRESASSGYANVAAKINTTASTYKPTPRNSQTQTTLVAASVSASSSSSTTRGESLGKALTPYGVCTVVEVRSDQFFVVKTKCGATGYLHADSVKLLHRRTNFTEGERVKTPYGQGEVAAYRDEDEVYEVKLDIAVAVGSAAPPMLFISDVHAESMLVPVSANGANYARLSSIFTMTRNSVYSASATVKASATGGLTTLSNVKSKVSTMAAIKMTKAKFQKGERVITSFGSGFVSDSRPLERIYEVQLRRLKFKGYFHESALQPFPYERVTHFIVDGKTIPAPDMPKNLPEHKRRDIITTAIRQARNGR